MAYRKLVLECAKELASQPARTRTLAQGLGRRAPTRLRSHRRRLGGGAARRVYETTDAVHFELLDDAFAQAAELIEEAIAAAHAEGLLPAAPPANVVPLFRDFGRTLRDDEDLYLKARGRQVGARNSAKARQRVADWYGPITKTMSM